MTSASGSNGNDPKWTLFDPFGIFNALTVFLVQYTVREHWVGTTYGRIDAGVTHARWQRQSSKNVFFGQLVRGSVGTV